MVDLRVARRYASALFQVALRTNTVQRTSEDLQRLQTLLDESPEFCAFLFDPRIARDRKRARMNELLQPLLQSHTLRLLELMVEKRREKLLYAICQEFQRLYEAHQGIVRATITSAIPLTPQEQSALVQKLEQGMGKQVIPTFEVESELLGGVKVQIGDYQIDGTLRCALENLREHVRLEIARRQIAISSGTSPTNSA